MRPRGQETAPDDARPAGLPTPWGDLVCPLTRRALRQVAFGEAAALLESELRPARVKRAGEPTPVGSTPSVLVRDDHELAYPVVDGIPVLLAPEMLLPGGRQREFDLRDARYAEAYEEMEHYNPIATQHAAEVESGRLANLEATSANLQSIASIARRPAIAASFPEPRRYWIDAPHDSGAELDAYRHLKPLEGKRVLQVGGSGEHALKFLQAGAAEAVALSPMVGELRFARALARHYGLDGRLRCVAAIAEEMPFADGSFDVLYAGGCVHHMVTTIALPECARVLAPGGKFAAVEPWRAPGYALGTRVFGKREKDVFCKPLTSERSLPLFRAFDRAAVIHHGALTRYPLVALGKLGLRLPTRVLEPIQRADDAVCSLLGPVRRLGSSVALLANVTEPARPHRQVE